MNQNDDLFGFDNQPTKSETERVSEPFKMRPYVEDNFDEKSRFRFTTRLEPAYYKKRAKGGWVVLLVFMILLAIRAVSGFLTTLGYSAMMEVYGLSDPAQAETFDTIASYAGFSNLIALVTFGLVLTAFVLSAKIKKMALPTNENSVLSPLKAIVVILILAIVSSIVYIIAEARSLSIDYTPLGGITQLGFTDGAAATDYFTTSIIGSIAGITVLLVFLSLSLARYIKLKNSVVYNND